MHGHGLGPPMIHCTRVPHFSFRADGFGFCFWLHVFLFTSSSNEARRCAVYVCNYKSINVRRCPGGQRVHSRSSISMHFQSTHRSPRVHTPGTARRTADYATVARVLSPHASLSTYHARLRLTLRWKGAAFDSAALSPQVPIVSWQPASALDQQQQLLLLQIGLQLEIGYQQLRPRAVVSWQG